MNKKVIFHSYFLISAFKINHIDVFVIGNARHSISISSISNAYSLNLSVHLSSTVRCTQPPDTGHCRNSVTKWYYRPGKQDCFRFNYGGCAGNDNRFESKDLCMTTCRGVTGMLLLGKKKKISILYYQWIRCLRIRLNGINVCSVFLFLLWNSMLCSKISKKCYVFLHFRWGHLYNARADWS